LGAENSKCWAIVNVKRQEMKPFRPALGSLRGSGRVGICSSEEELNELVRSSDGFVEHTFRRIYGNITDLGWNLMQIWMQHESLSLKEEKQLLREIKDLEATRPTVIANAATRKRLRSL